MMTMIVCYDWQGEGLEDYTCILPWIALIFVCVGESYWWIDWCKHLLSFWFRRCITNFLACPCSVHKISCHMSCCICSHSTSSLTSQIQLYKIRLILLVNLIQSNTCIYSSNASFKERVHLLVSMSALSNKMDNANGLTPTFQMSECI